MTAQTYREFLEAKARIAPKVGFRSAEEIDRTPGVIHMTNYETVRDGRLDPTLFQLLDAGMGEAA